MASESIGPGAEFLEWRGFTGGSCPRDLRATSGRALALLAGSMHEPVLVTVPTDIDAEVYVLFSLALTMGEAVTRSVADAVRHQPAEARGALEILDKSLGSRQMIVDGVHRLHTLQAASGDLADVLEPRRREIGEWLLARATVVIVDDSTADSVPVVPILQGGWDSLKLWEAAGEDPECFGLAVAVRHWLGETDVAGPLEPSLLVSGLWQGLPAKMRDLLALLVVHGRPIPRALFERTGLVSAETFADALRSWLVDEVGGAVRLAPSWYLHAPLPSAARGLLHRRLADAFAQLANTNSESALVVLEAHRHYALQPDMGRAREFAKYGAAYLLDHARKESAVHHYSVAMQEYEAVLRLDDDAGRTALGATARAYATHYRHFNQYRHAERPDTVRPVEDMLATLAGYEEALVLWPENALFWSRVVRCKFLLGQWVDALRALKDAYGKVPPHSKRDSVLIVRTAERLLERGELVPALLVATERQLQTAPYSLQQLWKRLQEGELIQRLWVPKARELCLREPRPLTLVREKNLWRASWLGINSTDAAPRGALAGVIARIVGEAIASLEQVNGHSDIASILDPKRAHDEDTRWMACLVALSEHANSGQITTEQHDAVFNMWRSASASIEKLRRPAIGAAPDNDYYLSWAYDDVPRSVVTIEVHRDGTCTWFARGADGTTLHGEGSPETAITSVAANLRAFS